MDPRFVTKNLHALLDYPVALALMGLPFLLQLGGSNPLALWLSVVTGVAALVLTVLTDHKLGLVRVLSYRTHLAVDGLVAVAFLLAPTLFGFAGLDALYYWVNGAAVAIVVGLHKPEPAAAAVRA